MQFVVACYAPPNRSLQNDVDALYRRSHSDESAPGWGRLLCAFDCTYITRALQQCQMHSERAMIGGIYTLDKSNNAWLSLESDKPIDLSLVVRAASMMEVVVWDPCAVQKVTLSACSLPIETNFSGPGSTMRGSWFMLELVGQILAHSDHLIKGLVFDAHGSHSLIRRALHGQTDSINMESLLTLPFWKDRRSWGIAFCSSCRSSSVFLKFLCCIISFWYLCHEYCVVTCSLLFLVELSFSRIHTGEPSTCSSVPLDVLFLQWIFQCLLHLSVPPSLEGPLLASTSGTQPTTPSNSDHSPSGRSLLRNTGSVYFGWLGMWCVDMFFYVPALSKFVAVRWIRRSFYSNHSQIKAFQASHVFLRHGGPSTEQLVPPQVIRAKIPEDKPPRGFVPAGTETIGQISVWWGNTDYPQVLWVAKILWVTNYKVFWWTHSLFHLPSKLVRTMVGQDIEPSVKSINAYT